MKKSKKKGKASGKAKKKPTKSKKAKSPAEVRQDISKLVSQHAMKMASAVIGEGERGQLGPTKYLLELAGVFPASDGSAPTEREESLAETVFRKLNVPTTPVKLNDEDEEEVVVIAAQEKKQGTELITSGAITSERERQEDAEKTQGPSTACVGSLCSPTHSGRDDKGKTQGPSTACVGSLCSPTHSGRDDKGKTQGPSTACVGSLCSPTHSGRDDREKQKTFTPERTEGERVDAGEPSGV